MGDKIIQLDSVKVEKAVAALRQMSSTLTEKKELLESINAIEMQICLKKIPQKEKQIKLKLPHSIKKPDVDVCLFVKDLDRTDREYDATVSHFQDILKKKGVSSITEIVPLKSLKTEYKPFEAKRNLSNAYDVFLADNRIIRLLPSYLGKHFYGKKKAPVQVNMLAKNLAAEIETALSNSRCSVGCKGSVSTALVAHLQMQDKDIAENVIASASQISQNIAGGSVNIKLLSLKLKESTSIPVYLGTGGPQDVTIVREKGPDDVEAEEISTLFGAKVKVFPNGRIRIIKDEGTDEEMVTRPKKARLSAKGRTGTRKSGPGNKPRGRGVTKNRKMKVK